MHLNTNICIYFEALTKLTFILKRKRSPPKTSCTEYSVKCHKKLFKSLLHPNKVQQQYLSIYISFQYLMLSLSFLMSLLLPRTYSGSDHCTRNSTVCTLPATFIKLSHNTADHTVQHVLSVQYEIIVKLVIII